MDFLKVSNISKQLDGNFVLKDISFTVQKFKKTAIVGESGSGKSTLLKIIGGLVQPDTGEVLFENKHVDGPNEKLIPGHPQIAYLSQHFELRNNYRVEEILEYANKLSNKEAKTLYEICDISQLLTRKTDQVSGGEKQRIAMARLLIGSPKLFLLDEPFSNLDMLHRNILKKVIRDMGEKLKITCVLVSHDPVDTLSWADEIIVLKDGQIIQQGTPEQIYRQPVNEYAAGLFGKYHVVSKEDITIKNRSKPVIKKQTIFVRPEAYTITDKKGKIPLPGKVQEVFFVGSAYEIEVLLNSGSVVTVRSDQGKYNKGDKVYVSLKKL